MSGRCSLKLGFNEVDRGLEDQHGSVVVSVLTYYVITVPRIPPIIPVMPYGA